MAERKWTDFPGSQILLLGKEWPKKNHLLVVVVNLCVCGLCEHWKKHLYAPDSIHDRTLEQWS